MNDYEPFRNGKAITPHDTNPVSPTTAAIFVGGTGNITLRLMGDTADTVLNGCIAGTIYPLRASHVRAAGTTATGLVALS